MTNKPMLSVEREHRLKIHRKPFLDLESGAKTCEIRDCSDRDFQVGDSVLLMLVDETGNPTPNELRRKITHIQTGYGLPDCLCVLSYEPAAQHQGEPVAYTTAGMLEIVKRLPLTGRIGAKATKDERWNIPLFLGQAEQPAPAVVVMPERMDAAPFTTIDRGSKNYKAGYNAGLAEAARLNGLRS